MKDLCLVKNGTFFGNKKIEINKMKIWMKWIKFFLSFFDFALFFFFLISLSDRKNTVALIRVKLEMQEFP